MKSIRKTALAYSLLTTLYVIAVGSFMYLGAIIKIGKANTFLVPIAMLMLFVFSAALTGFLVVGKPVQFYIDGKKKEALSLLLYTLLFLFIFTIIFILLLLLFTH
jgi:hypothetical protein